MKKTLDLWRKHIWIDWVIAAIVTDCFVMWIEGFAGHTTIADSLKGNRGYIYSVFASSAASLLGFILTAVSIIISQFSSERLTIIREDAKLSSQMWDVFRSATRTLGVATIASLVALICDTDAVPLRLFLYGSFFTVFVASLRVVRCILLLERLVLIISMPAIATGS